MSRVIVIGGGPAGMFASYFAAKSGHQVFLLEKNEKLGKKLYITGKGRCNITNAADMEELFEAVVSNRKFLYSAFYSFDNQSVMDFFHEYGLETKIERGNRVFPVSDHSSDVIKTLEKALKEVGVSILLNTKVKELLICEKAVQGVALCDGTKMMADNVVVATGGFSYQSTGSDGDGYRFAENSGHRLIPRTPSLVPFNIKENWVKELQGLSLKNVAIEITGGKKTVYSDFGEMLFTHFGVSGPMILSASASIKPELFQKELVLHLDLKPALDMEQLDKRLLRDFEENKNRQYKNSLNKLLPATLIPVFLENSRVDSEKRVNEITKEERLSIMSTLKNMTMTIEGLRGFNEAIITKGGVSVKDINPSTMESKLISKLYFCGEVLDLDAYTGGFNLQIAWSTGYLAGISIE